MYFGTEEGIIYGFEGTNNIGEAFESYWTTPRDAFGYMQHLKKVNKCGAIIKVKNPQNSRTKTAEKTNKRGEWKLVKEVATNGFDFNGIDFANFSFVAGDYTYIVYRVKEKKIIDLRIKVYSDIKDKPFGLIYIKLEAFISGYVKR